MRLSKQCDSGGARARSEERALGLTPFSQFPSEYYLRGVPKERAPEDQHRTAPNAHQTAPWPMGLGWGVSGGSLCATFMPRLCVYGRLLAPAHTGAATEIGR